MELFDTGRRPQWCPGCGNYGILAAVRRALSELELRPEEVVAVTGIGCHGRMTEYLAVNAFHAIHGRAIPLAVGVKLVNPKLKVIVHTGDGDAYSIGLSHLLHAVRRNAGVTVIVHDNMIYGLTAGQAGPTTPQGVRTRTTPTGNPEEPFNPLLLALAAGATFVARGFSDDVEHLKELVKRGLVHRGLALINVIQPCTTFYDVRAEVRQRLYRLDREARSFEGAVRLATERERIPIGVIYEVEKPAYEELFSHAREPPATWKPPREAVLKLLERLR